MRKILSLFMVLAFFLHGTGSFPHSYAVGNRAGEHACLAPLLVHSPQAASRADTLQPALDMLQAYCLGKPSIAPEALLPHDLARLCQEVSPASVWAIISMVREGNLRWLDCIRHQKNTSLRIKELLDSLVVSKHRQENDKGLRSSETMLERKAAVLDIGDLAVQGALQESVLHFLVLALQDPEWFVRKTAIHALTKIGWQALPVLLHALQTFQPEHAHRAIMRTLGAIGSRLRPECWQGIAEQLVTVWMRGLGAAHASVREAAAIALGKAAGQGVYGQEVVSGLVRCLSDKDPSVREAAADTLGKIGPPAAQYKETIPALVKVLKDREESVREAAARTLAKIGAMTTLQEALSSGNEDVRLAVLGALRRVRVPFQCFNSALVNILVKILEKCSGQDQSLEKRLREDDEVLDDDDYHTLLLRRIAMRDMISACSWILGDIVPRLELTEAQINSAVEVLLQAKGHAAFSAIAKIGVKAVPFLLSNLRSGLDSGEEKVWQSAVKMLAMIGTDAAQHPEVIPTLLDLLGERGERGYKYRRVAAEALGKTVPVEAVNNALLKALNRVFLHDDDETVRSATGTALAHMGPEAFPYLSRALMEGFHDKNSELCQNSVRALGKMGAVAGCPKGSIVSELLWCLGRKDNSLVWGACNAFEHMGTQAIPILLQYLKDEKIGLRRLAVQALWKAGKACPEDAGLVAGLLGAFDDPDDLVKQIAADTLVALKCPIEDETVMWAVYMAALETENNLRKKEAAEALGNIVVRPDNKKQMIAALNKALQDKEEGVRECAVMSLAKVASDLKDNQYLLTSLLTVLKDRHFLVRRAAVLAMKNITSIIADFDDKEPLVSALMVFDQTDGRTHGRIGLIAEGIIKRLSTSDAVLSAETVQDMASPEPTSGEPVEEDITGLLEALNQGIWYDREEAAEKLAKIGPRVKDKAPIVAALLANVQYEHSAVR